MPMEPRDAAAELARAEGMRAGLTSTLRLPSGFHESIGAAVAVQVATTAYAVGQTRVSAGTVAVLVAGVAVFGVVAVVQLMRFRRSNGVWVGGLASRAVLGSTNLASVVYAASLAAAGWAALSGRWWLTVLAAAAGGAGYALSARHWWATYLRDPVKNARGQSALYAAGCLVVALAALVLVARGRW
jgi:hypothetical protein